MGIIGLLLLLFIETRTDVDDVETLEIMLQTFATESPDTFDTSSGY